MCVFARLFSGSPSTVPGGDRYEEIKHTFAAPFFFKCVRRGQPQSRIHHKLARDPARLVAGDSSAGAGVEFHTRDSVG
jgi:hypothetical protein